MLVSLLLDSAAMLSFSLAEVSPVEESSQSRKEVVEVGSSINWEFDSLFDCEIGLETGFVIDFVTNFWRKLLLDFLLEVKEDVLDDVEGQLDINVLATSQAPILEEVESIF